MITSTANKKVKRIIQLNKKAGQRKKEDVFIVEGIKMFIEAPESYIQEIFISESFKQSIIKKDIMDKLDRCGYEEMTDEVFGKISDTQTPQGILCVMKQFHYLLEDMIQKEPVPLFLVLEDLQDPGNLGTIMRTGEGAGVTGIIMSKDTVDIYNPKTIRGTMGSIYRVPFFYTEDLLKTIYEIKSAGIHIYAAHLKGVQSYDTYEYSKGAAFLIGNEGNGLSDKIADGADTFIRIPMKGKVESLNAAIAAALLMYEAARYHRS